MDSFDHTLGRHCLLRPSAETRVFQPAAEDILSDEELLDLFRIIKQITRKRPDAERLAKLLFCISYSLGDHIKQYRPGHHDTVVFRDDEAATPTVHAVKLSYHPSCCDAQETHPMGQWALGPASAWDTSTTSNTPGVPLSPTKQPLPLHPPLQQPQHAQNSQQQQQPLSLSYMTHPPTATNQDLLDATIVRPYTQFRPSFPKEDLFPTQKLRQGSFASTSSTLTNNNHHPLSAPTPPNGTNNTHSTTSQSHSPFDTPFANSPLIGPPHMSSQLNSMLHGPMPTTRVEPDPATTPVVMEPRQRGFYYQYGRIEREPPLLRRFAEQGVLTQASLLRKRRRQCSDQDNPYVLSTLPAATKKPKIPHRHGEFEQRRDDIIHRMRSITVSDLEQKSQRLPQDTTLAIETAELPPDLVPSNLSSEEAADFLEPSLRILTYHSNLKPHLDNGMNQNGIYYNVDYYRLYLAFVQFQKAFGILFPHEVVKIRKVYRKSSVDTAGGGDDPEAGSTQQDENAEFDSMEIPLPPSSMSATVSAMSERDRDRDRNMNMKAYRAWIEPLLTETNWAAFRRNLVVGERMVLLTKVVGQGVLLMTKELSGSKLHLTFTNSEWDEFIGGLHLGKWDATIQWDQEHDTTPCLRENGSKSRLVDELKFKFLSECWFHTDGSIVAPPIRKQIIDQRKQQAQLQWQLQENQENTSPPASSPPNANNSANSSSSAASASSASSPPSTSAKQTTPSPPAISPSTEITPPAGQITTAP